MVDALKLLARDAEDLAVVSAYLQDALIPLSDMQYLAEERRFVLVASRFRWENCSETADAPPSLDADAPDPAATDIALEPCRAYERVHCGLCVEGVEVVRRRGFDQRNRGRILELLDIRAEGGSIELVFAGGAALRLEGADLACRIDDFGQPWPTRWRPHHAIGDSD